MAFALMVTLAALLGGSLWLAGELGPGDLGFRRPPALRTVDVGDLLESALRGAEREVQSRADGATAAAPEAEVANPEERTREEVAEEEVPEPAPFVEARLPEPDSTQRASDVDASPGAPAPEVAPRDQDAWALLIRRMLSLYRRMAVGLE